MDADQHGFNSISRLKERYFHGVKGDFRLKSVFRTNGLAVFLAQPKSRRFAGLGLVRACVQKDQRSGHLLRWFV